MKKLTSNFVAGLSVVAVLGLSSCGGETKEVEQTETIEVVPVEIVIEETDIIVVHEDGFYHQNVEERNAAKEHEGHDHGDEGHPKPRKMMLANDNFAPQTGDIEAYMENKSFETIDVDATEELAIPVDVNQTLVAFDKKSNFEGQVRIVSSSESGEITNIIFTGKDHMDEYDVSAGLTGKETRQLRKELKHMSKNGRLFMYEEGSNIVYLMDSKELVTDEEVTQEDIDNMVIEAIIWQDTQRMDKSEATTK